MTIQTPTPDANAAVHHALRTALATAICLVIGEWCQIKNTNLAVWTTYMVMVQYAFTSFQKGLERVVGRGLGILAGLLVSTCLEGQHFLGEIVIFLILVGCFYIYFGDRLAYTFLNAGLYAVVLYEIGNATPSAAMTEGLDMFAAVVLGVVVADAVIWLAGAERKLSIEFGEAPLWPLRIDWLNQSLMLAVTVVITARVAIGLDISALDAVISVMFLTIAPDIQSLLQKGELRIVGALAASAYAIASFFVLALEPSFALLVGLLFLGQFLAAYHTRTGGPYSYVGLQMGLVLPMLLIDSPERFGSLSSAAERLEGILIALLISLVVGAFWPRYPLKKRL